MTMNIAIYIARFFPAIGGIVNYVVNLVKKLIKYYINIEIHADNIIPVNGRKVAIPRGKMLSNKMITLVPEIVLIPSLHLRLVKATEADIINIHGHAEAYTLTILMRLSKLRKPIVLTTHGSLVSSLYRIGKRIDCDYMFRTVETKLKYKIFNSVSIKLIDKYIDMIITPSELEKKGLLMNDIPSYRTIIIKNFIPDRYFEFRPQEPETILKQLGLVPFKYIITVARIDRNKSIYQVIKAIANLHNQGINIKYVIIGPDEGALSRCLALARKYDIERSIMFLGSIINKRLILTLERYASAFILPSYIETAQPLSILESMSQATPIIISNTANFIGKAVKHMFNGLVFGYSNIRSLLYAIRILLEDEALRKKLGENAFKYAYEHHKLSKAVDKYVEIFKTLYETYHG